MAIANQNATRSLITFIRSYFDLMEKQLQSVHGTMRETVEGVMQGINQISEKTAQKKRQANEVLVKTYTDPDADAKKSMNDVQDEVSRIFEAANAGALETNAKPTAGNDEMANKLRRSAGLFSKHMEALETLDTDLQTLLMDMMGALSRDDVIAQRIDHVLAGMHAIQTSLSYILTDFENRCKDTEIARFTEELKSIIFRTYTMEDEKKVHYQVFPEDRKTKKSAS